MPDFARILVVAVLSFILLYIIFTGSFYFSSEQQSNYIYEYYKTINLGEFFVLYEEKNLIPITFSGEVRKGIIENIKKCFDFKISDLNSINRGTIDFYVEDTNSYGNLIFSLNNKTIYNKLKYIGFGSIDINVKDLNNENILCIEAESSGFRFWASTVYKLDFNLSLFKVNSSYIRSFELSENELLVIKSAKLKTTVTGFSGEGNLTIKLNDNEIYSGRNIDILVDIPVNYLKPSNKIEFIAAPQTSWLLINTTLELS